MIAPRGTLDPGTAKKPAAFFRALSAHLTPVEFPYQTGVRLRRWVERHFARAEIAVSEDAMATLLSRCPQDMTGLSGEMEKLIAYCLANHIPAVTPEIVTRVTSPALREDAFVFLTRRALLPSVQEGLEALFSAGFADVKLNCVPIAGVNEDDIVQLADFARQ